MKAEQFAASPPDQVLNQPPALENYDLFEQDVVLREALEREGGGFARADAAEFGALLGRAETLKLGDLANRYLPVLRTHDCFGHRVDEVDFHPAYHVLLGMAVAHEAHSLPWHCRHSGGHVARVALNILRNQVDEGTSCPISMAYAVIPALRIQPEVAAEWEPRLLSTQYDSRCIPAESKTGAMIGMAMTERQGGSDVRANSTRASALSRRGPGEAYVLTGHKWFCSAPMSDAFLVLAQVEDKGLSCFLLPRWTRKVNATRSTSTASRTNWAIGRTHRARWNSVVPGPG